MTILDLLTFKRWGYVSDANYPVLGRSVIAANMRPPFRGAGNRAKNRRAARLAVIIKEAEAADIHHDSITEGYARRPFRTNPHE